MKRGLGLGVDYPVRIINTGIFPETVEFMNKIGIPNDSTVYYPATIYQRTGADFWGYINILVGHARTIGKSKFCGPIYPILGGTDTRHKYDLFVRDRYEIAWNGGWTHGPTGALPNGTNAYAKTGYIWDDEVSSLFKSGMCYYSRVNNTTGTQVPMGVFSNTGGGLFAQWNSTAANAVIGDLGSVATWTPTNTNKFHIFERFAQTDIKVYRDGVQIASDTGTTGAGKPDLELYVGARNSNANPQFYTVLEMAESDMHEDFTLADIAAWTAAINEYQTNLGRNI